jgi:hypothetical protein
MFSRSPPRLLDRRCGKMLQGFRLWLCALLFLAPAALGSEERRPRRLRKLRRFGRGAATPVQGGMCDDSCEDHAKNGRCDDGSAAIALPSPAQEHRIYCALGTDCSDCGSVPRRPPPAKLKEMMPQPGDGVPTEPLPPQGLTGVPLLRERKVEVHAAWTKTQPSFLMPYTNPREDFDVSENMHTKRAVEPLYNLYWHRLSQQVPRAPAPCVRPRGVPLCPFLSPSLPLSLGCPAAPVRDRRL